MMIAHCDACGLERPEPMPREWATFESVGPGEIRDNIDLCPKCFKEFFKWRDTHEHISEISRQDILNATKEHRP